MLYLFFVVENPPGSARYEDGAPLDRQDDRQADLKSLLLYFRLCEYDGVVDSLIECIMYPGGIDENWIEPDRSGASFARLGIQDRYSSVAKILTRRRDASHIMIEQEP